MTGHRGQLALALSMDRYKDWDDGSVSFILTHPMKKAKTGDKLLEVKVHKYDTQSKLCVLRTHKAYMERTSLLTKSKMLFVSFISPHGEISRDTVDRWTTHVLRVSGVNVKKYGGHSLRGAVVSAGARLAISSDVLMKYGSWRNERTMARRNPCGLK